MSEVLNISVSIGQDWSGDFPYVPSASGDAIMMVFYNNNTSCTQIATENYSGEPGEVVIDPGVKYTCNLPLKKSFFLDEQNVTYKLFILNLELQEATLLFSGGVAITPDPNAIPPDIWDGEYPTRLKTVESLPGLEYYKPGDEVFVLGDGKYLHNGTIWEKISGEDYIPKGKLTIDLQKDIEEGKIKSFVRNVEGDISTLTNKAGNLTLEEYYSAIKSFKIYQADKNYLYKVDTYYNNHASYGFYLAISRKLKSGGDWALFFATSTAAPVKDVGVNSNGITKVVFSKDDNVYNYNGDWYVEAEIDYTNIPETNRATQTVDEPIFVLSDEMIVEASEDVTIGYSNLTTDLKNDVHDGIIQNFVRYTAGDLDELNLSGNLTKKKFFQKIKSVRIYGSSKDYLHKIDAYYNNHVTSGFYFAMSRKLKTGGSWAIMYSASIPKSVVVNGGGVTKVIYDYTENDYGTDYKVEIEIDYSEIQQSNRISQTADDPLFVIKDECIVANSDPILEERIDDGIMQNFVRYTAGSLDDLNLNSNLTKRKFYQKIKSIRVYGSNKDYLHKIDAYYNNHATYGFYFSMSRKLKTGGSWAIMYGASIPKSVVVNGDGVTKVIYDYTENDYGTDYKVEIEIDYSEILDLNRISQTADEPLFVLKDECIVSSSSTGSVYEQDEIVVKKLSSSIIQIYIKGNSANSSRYIKYQIQKNIDIATNLDSWGLYQGLEKTRIGEFDFSDTSIGRVVNGGEWECAIMIVGEADFMGNLAHGDELLTIETLLVDGVQKDLTTIENFSCKELKFIQVSNLEKPSTSTAVAEHTKEYTFTSNGLLLNQKIKWLSVQDLSLSYLTMLPIDRNNGTVQITDKAYRDDAYIIDDVSVDGFTGGVNDQSTNDVKKINIWGDTSGISAEVEIIEVSHELPNAKFFVSNAAAYNKFYFDFSGAHTTAIGEEWVVKSFYKIFTRN